MQPAEEGGSTGEPVQDFTEEGAFLEWAGVGFGRTENFRLHLALKHLAAKYPSAKNLRFFGKVLGSKADYFVAEGVLEAGEEEAEDAKDALGNLIQKTGEGPNRFTYFVTPSVGGGEEWVKLPRVTPHQVIVARKNRRLLTGDLTAAVGGHPPFPGNEANYLRALLALISAGTAVAPSGVFTAVDGDENGAIQPNEEEFEAPDLSTLDSWVHTSLALNAIGRTKPNPPQTDADGNEIPDENAPEPSAPLKPVAEDPPVNEADAEGGAAWDVRVCPVSGLAEGATPSPALVVLRSLRFPGAVTVGVGKKFTSLYIGGGHEVSVGSFQPALPPTLPAEYDFAGPEEKVVREKPDVATDPDAGKAAGEGEEGAE